LKTGFTRLVRRNENHRFLVALERVQEPLGFLWSHLDRARFAGGRILILRLLLLILLLGLASIFLFRLLLVLRLRFLFLTLLLLLLLILWLGFCSWFDCDFCSSFSFRFDCWSCFDVFLSSWIAVVAAVV
jgi:hypothetical protein